MDKIYIQNFKTAYGELILGSFNDQLCLCDWRFRKMREAIDKRLIQGLKAEFEERESDIILKARRELTEYFDGKRKQFQTLLLLVGTDFQKMIWKELLKIPYGETESYLGLSQKINNEKAIRAVAAANGANALSIFVPCHRIVGSKKELTGYAGGLTTKKKLLQLESGRIEPEQMELF